MTVEWIALAAAVTVGGIALVWTVYKGIDTSGTTTAITTTITNAASQSPGTAP